MEQLVVDLADRGAHRLVLKLDDGMVNLDRQVLYQAAHRAGCQDQLIYEHLRASVETLFAIRDAVAWSWAKGGEWRKRVDPLISGVHTVWPQ